MKTIATKTRARSRFTAALGVGAIGAALALLGAGACGALEPPGGAERPPASGTSGAILNAPPATDTRGAVKVLTVAGGCSGTLITNNWVLTAKHCFPTSTGGSTPLDLTTVTLQDGQQQTVATNTDVFKHPSQDVVAIHLPQPFDTLGGINSIHNTPYLFDNGSLQGKTVRCESYGRSTCDPNIDDYGTLRTTELTVFSDQTTSPFLSVVAKTAPNQNLWHGDSGGSCFTTGLLASLFGEMLTGVTHNGATDDCPTQVTQVRPAVFREWLDQQMFSGWGAIGGTTTFAPAIAASTSSSGHVFLRRSGTELWVRKFISSGEWTNWISIPAITIGGPAAASRGSGQMAVAVISSDNAAYLQEVDGSGAWPMAWTFIGKPPGIKLWGTPALVSSAPGSLTIIARSTSNDYYMITRHTPTSAWTAWSFIGGGSSDPAALAVDSTIWLFWVDPSTSMNVQTWSASTATWGSASSLGTGFKLAAAATSSAPHRVDLFGVQLDGTIAHRRNFLGWETTWNRLPGAVGTSGVSATSRTKGVMNLVVKGSDNQVWIDSYPR